MKKTSMDVHSAVVLTLHSVNNSIAWTAKTTCFAVHKPKKHKSGGFTLIELMIVIAIIGILAAIAIPNFIAYRDKAYCSATEHDASTILASIADYFAIPSSVTLPFPIKLPTDSGVFAGLKLFGNNTATITGPVSNICVIVKEASNRCPEEYELAGKHWIKVDGIWYFRKCMDE